MLFTASYPHVDCIVRTTHAAYRTARTVILTHQWMSSSRKSIHAINKPGQSTSGISGLFAKMGAVAEEYLAAKMLMILGGLWALNWLY